MIAEEVYLTLGGGLGDVFWLYLGGHNGWQFLEDLKQKSPKTKVKVLSATHNPQVEELLKYNPNVSEFKEFGWCIDGNKIWEKYKGRSIKLNTLKPQLKRKKNIIYLTEEDNKTIQEIIKEPFVLIHPFAGEFTRCGITSTEYIPIINKIIEKTKLKVVVVGSSYVRQNRIHKISQEEVFEYEKPGLYNLVGKTNARICATLAKHQHSFIGSWSAYSCLSWVYNKPNTIIMPERSAHTFKTKKISKNGRWYGKKDIKIITTPKHIKQQNRNINLDNITNTIFKYYE